MKKFITGLALFAFSLMAQAAPLVVNGDFENGVTGWAESAVPTGGDPLDYELRGVISFPDVGSNHFYSVGTTVPVSLSQSISTVAGTFYDLSFQARGLTAPEPVNNYLNVVFGTTLFSPVNFTTGTFTTYLYKGLQAGVGSNTLLTFTASSAESFIHFDNVAIQVSAVPEPETYAMMLLGLGLIGYSIQRRRKA
ncbi:MAG: hypothetical protein ACI8WM_002323 [Burkholderiaceae bacterium]|jgi:hypothetical protein